MPGRSPLHHRRGAGTVWVLVIVALVFGAYLLLKALLGSPPGPVTYTVWTGMISGTAPSAVNRPTPVTYHVFTQDVTVPASAGPGATPLRTGPKVKQPGIAVTFVLDGIHAVFDDDTRTRTVTTDGQGNAVFIIKPKFDGSSGLTMSYVTSDGLTVTDADHPTFEVDAP